MNLSSLIFFIHLEKMKMVAAIELLSMTSFQY
jgi:hypothetical protein